MTTNLKYPELDSHARQVWLDGLKDGDPVVICFAKDNTRLLRFAHVSRIATLWGDNTRRIHAGEFSFSREGRWFDHHYLLEPSKSQAEVPGKNPLSWIHRLFGRLIRKPKKEFSSI